MGLGKFLKKSIKNSFRGGSLWDMGVKKIHDQISPQKLLGLDALKDLAGSQEAQLRQQLEANKLDSAIESQNVATFDDSASSGFTGTDTRRRKKAAGGYSSGLGLQL